MPFFRPSKAATLATLLIFFCLASLVNAAIYALSEFLSNYPASKLALFLLSTALLNSIINNLITPFIAKNPKTNSIKLTGIAICMAIGVLSLSSVSGYWVPFIKALAINVMATSLIIIGWNIAPLAFGIRDYKHIIGTLIKAASLGSIVSSFLISGLLRVFPLESALLTLIFFLCCFSLAIFFLPITADPHKKAQTAQEPPRQYPLYRNLVLFFITVMASKTLIDYVFGFYLSTHLEKSQIGSFLGFFNGIANLAGLLSAFTLSKKAVEYLKLSGILWVTPVFVLLSSLLVLIHPSLLTICILTSNKNLFIFNHAQAGVEISLNILPSMTRLIGKSQLRSIVTPAVEITVYTCTLLVASFATTSELITLLILVSLVGIYSIKRVETAYRKTLEEDIEFKRFNMAYEINPANADAFFETIKQALTSDDTRTLLFGMSLLKKLPDNPLPDNFYTLVNHKSPLVRKAALDQIKLKKEPLSSEYLLKQLERETDPEAKFDLFTALKVVDSEAAQSLAKTIIHDQSSSLYPLALGLLLKGQDDTKHAWTLSELDKLSMHPSSIIRKEIAYVIGSSKIEELDSCLARLISDSNDAVAEEALAAAGYAKRDSIIPLLTAQLSSKRAPMARFALSMFGQSHLSPLIDQEKKPKILHQIIKVIANLPGENSENILSSLGRNQSILMRTLAAREANYRALEREISPAFKQEAYQLTFEETKVIAYLNSLFSKQASPHIEAEINSRIKMARERILQWLAVANDAKLINHWIPSLLSSSPNNLAAYEKALELLEIHLEDNELKRAIIKTFEKQQKIEPTSDTPSKYSDSWLEILLKTETDPKQVKNMDDLLKVFELRSIALFRDLPGEILLSIAAETKIVTFDEGDIIFNENDLGGGLYAIISGKVKIVRQGKLLTTLHTHDFFGELSLIDDAPRTASAIAKSDCSLLLLEKSTFDRITDDHPEVLRVVSKTILGYLRSNLASKN